MKYFKYLIFTMIIPVFRSYGQQILTPGNSVMDCREYQLKNGKMTGCYLLEGDMKIKTGIWNEYDNKNRLKVTTDYKHGFIVSKKTFYKNGEVKTSYSSAWNSDTAYYIVWRRDHSVKELYKYFDFDFKTGKAKNAILITKDLNGNVKSISFFRNGENLKYQRFRSSGSLEREITVDSSGTKRTTVIYNSVGKKKYENVEIKTPTGNGKYIWKDQNENLRNHWNKYGWFYLTLALTMFLGGMVTK